MVIEQTEQGILIKTTAPVNMKAVQKIIDYFNMLEITSRSQGTEEQASQLSDEVDKKWWQENRPVFLNDHYCRYEYSVQRLTAISASLI